MGIYLSAPKTDKVSEDGENDKLRYGSSSMQGWRSTMEDAVSLYVVLIHLDDAQRVQLSSSYCLVFVFS